MNPEIQAFASAVDPIARAKAKEFLRDAAPDAAGLTENQLGAIWRNAQYVSIVYPLLPDDPSAAELAASERLVLQNTRDLEVISELEKQDAEKIARIKAKALKFAQAIGASAAAGLLVSLSNSIPKPV